MSDVRINTVWILTKQYFTEHVKGCMVCAMLFIAEKESAEPISNSDLAWSLIFTQMPPSKT